MQLEIIKKQNTTNKYSILFVHGAYHAAWCWNENFTSFFYNHGYNVYAMSFRNHGKSEKVDDINSIKSIDLSNDLIKVINTIGGKVILITHSLGCKITQMCLERIYSSIQSLILLTPMPVRNNFWQLFLMSRKQKKKDLDYVLFSERLNIRDKEKYMALLNNESKKVEYSMMKRQKRFSSTVKNIPTLVIGSYNDQCVVLQAIKDNAKIHNADMTVLDNVCHDMMLDPDWEKVAKVILEFIKKSIDK